MQNQTQQKSRGARALLFPLSSAIASGTTLNPTEHRRQSSKTFFILSYIGTEHTDHKNIYILRTLVFLLLSLR
eukprot:gene4124-2969_t